MTRLRRASPKISERERSRMTLHWGTFERAYAITWPESPFSPGVSERMPDCALPNRLIDSRLRGCVKPEKTS